jgi:catechol 2,3-dioxygenase-like lactoylglutathione lyase family enzyme
MTTDAESRESAPPTIGFRSVVLDTDDPPGLAEFYTRLLGWEITWTADDWVTISGGPGTRIAFQLALNYQPPTWPDDTIPQQLHIDFGVEDLPAAAAYAESIGARRVEGPDKSPDFIVFLDPSGHPFCLCR